MPEGSAFFDTIVRQPPIDDETLDPADNLEEFGPISEEDLEHFERSRAGRGRDRLRCGGHVRRHGIRRHRAGARRRS